MNAYSESNLRAVFTASRPCRAGPFFSLVTALLYLTSMQLFSTTAIAQTGLPLNFSPLSNPLPNPQSFYCDSDPNIPLGDKTPLILVHGIDLKSGLPSASADGWDNFCFWFYSTPSIKNRFKLYRFAYQSNLTSVQSLGDYLSQLLNANDGSASDQKLAAKDIVVLAHSMGGLVARRFMEGQRQAKAAKWNQSVLRLITLGTPHHGTPLANRCDYVLNPLPDYAGALGYKFKHELGTIDFAILAAGVSLGNGLFHVIPAYNQPNRLDLLWDNYNGLFSGGFSPDEVSPPTAMLNSIASAQSYDSKLFAYAGYYGDGDDHPFELDAAGDILANGLAIPSDGIVPVDSAWFQGRIGNSQIRFFNDYDHYQLMHSKTQPGDVPSLSDPLFTMIGVDLVNALPVSPLPTISAVTPRILTPLPLPQTQSITINGTGFTTSSRLTFNDGVNPPYTDKVPIYIGANELRFNIAVGPNPSTWTINVVNGASESLPYTFYVVNGTKALTSLSINGPAAVGENGSGQFTAVAYFSDGSQQTVTSSTAWSENSNATSISSSGLLTAGSVGGATPVTVSASYSAGGVVKTATASVLIINSGGGGTQVQELIVNGGFESGSTGWSATTVAGGTVPSTGIGALSYPHSGSWYGYLGNVNNALGSVHQFITIPANAQSVTLTFYLNVVTTEITTGNPPFDVIDVNLRTVGDTLIRKVTSYSEADKGVNANGSYNLKTLDLTPFVTAYQGQQVILQLFVDTDGLKTTIFRIDDVSVQAVVPIPVTLASLLISGPSSVTEGTTAQYSAVAIFSDGSTNIVTPNTWGENSTATTISGSGLLTAGQVNADTSVSLYASYTYNGVTREVYRDVNIGNLAPIFTYLAISGPSSINENSSGQFTATAIFSDGSSKAVSPSWSENSTAASISGSGQLISGEIGDDLIVTVSASYTIGGVNHDANQDVRIVNVPVPTTLSSLSINGSNSINENSSGQFTATAIFSDGSSQTVIPTWSEDSSVTGISIFGLLVAGEVVSDTQVNISASYTADGVTRTASKSVTVVNGTVIPAYTLVVNASNGTVAKNPNQGSYASGSQVMLTATPSSGYEFSNWSGDGSGSQNPLTLTMDGNKSVAANFTFVTSPLLPYEAKSARALNTFNSRVCAPAGDGGFVVFGDFTGTITVGSQSFTANGTTADIYGVKFDAAGQIVWARQYGGVNEEMVTGCTKHPAGGWAISGYFRVATSLGSTSLNSAGSRDAFLARMAENGEILWSRRGGGSQVDYGNQAAIDGVGNCFLVGQFTASATFSGGATVLSASGSRFDIFVAKYNVNGDFQWAKSFGGTAYDTVTCAVADSAGNIYLGGTFETNASFGPYSFTVQGNQASYDGYLTKLNPSGDFVWAKHFGEGSGESSGDYVNFVTVSSNGTCFFGGSYDGPMMVEGKGLPHQDSQTAFVGMVNANGSLEWLRAFPVSKTFASFSDLYQGVAAADGGLFIGGRFRGIMPFGSTSITNGSGVSGMEDNIFLGKMDFSGNPLWPLSGFSTNDAFIIYLDETSVGSLRMAARFSSVSPIVFSPLPPLAVAGDELVLSEFGPFLPTTPPTLGFTKGGSQIVFNWPATAGGFILEASTSLGSSWTQVLGAPIIVGDQFIITNDIVFPGTKFYRLRK